MNKDEFLQRLYEIYEKYTDRPPEFSKQEKESAVRFAKENRASIVIKGWEEYQRDKPGRRFTWFVKDYESSRKQKKSKGHNQRRCPLCFSLIKPFHEQCPLCQLGKEAFEYDQKILDHYAHNQDRIREMCHFINAKYRKMLKDSGREKTDKEMLKWRKNVLVKFEKSLPWKKEGITM